MLVYIGGEDFVTKQVAKRLVEYCLPQYNIEFEDLTFRDHGTRALERVGLMLNLAKQSPVVAVFDSDNTCIIELIKKYVQGKTENDYATINFAVDEAEAWLLADRISFAKYFNIPVKTIPIRGALSLEIADSMPYKTSLYILIELVPLSKNGGIKSVLACDKPGKKPSTYNSAWGEYISKYWDIEEAIKNSESLERAVKRIKTMLLRAVSVN